MLIVDLKPRKLAVTFTHSLPVKGMPRGTVCKIHELRDGMDPIFLAEGRSICSADDKFEKSVGRKQALTKAVCQHVYNNLTKRCRKCRTVFNMISQLRLTKADRGLIWDAYHRRGVAGVDVAATIPVGMVPPEHAFGLHHLGMD